MSRQTHVTERSTHDDSLVSVLLVVVEDFLDGLHTWVGITLVRLARRLLVPVKDLYTRFKVPRDEISLQSFLFSTRNAKKHTHTSNKWRNEGHARLGTSDSLRETEQERQVAVNLFLLLEFASGLNTFPRRSDLDQDAFFGDPDGFV